MHYLYKYIVYYMYCLYLINDMLFLYTKIYEKLLAKYI